MVKQEVQDEADAAHESITQKVGETVIGLKLGKRVYFEDGSAGSSRSLQKFPIVSKNNSSNGDNNNNNRSSKKQNVSSSSSSSTHVPRCRAEGCKASLSTAKDYYRRHKVCEGHSKAVMVKVGNLEQRFCQQCSRFHILDEFDEGKRSCRRRLAGHNQRRRKRQPEDIHSLHSASFPYLQDGKHLLSNSLIGNPYLFQQHHQKSANSMGFSLDHTQILKLLGIPNHPPLQLQRFVDSTTGILMDSHGLAFSKPLEAVGLMSSQASPLPSHPPSGRALSLLSSSLGFLNDSCTMSLGVSQHPPSSMEQIFAQNEATLYPQILSRSASQPCFTPLSSKHVGMAPSSQNLCISNRGFSGLPTNNKEQRELPLMSTLDGRSFNFLSHQNEFQRLFGEDTQYGRNNLSMVEITGQASNPQTLQQTELERLKSYESMFGR